MAANENVFSSEQDTYQQRFGHHMTDSTEEIQENSKSKQMKYETPGQEGIASLDSKGFEGSFNTNPTGREILVSRAEKIMEEYHGKVANDEEELQNKKKLILTAANKMIMKLEERNFQTRLNLLKTMSAIVQELQEHLEMIEPVEEELASFTAGLEMFFKDIK